MIDAIVNWAINFGNSLAPVGVLIQMLLWGGSGFALCWKFFSHKAPTTQALLANAQKNVDYWKNQFAEKEAEADKLDEIARIAQERLPDVVLDKANTERKSGNFERSQSLIEEWLEMEKPAISDICIRASEWRLAFTEYEDDDFILIEAQRQATIAALLAPDNQTALQLKVELDGQIAGREFTSNRRFNENDERWRAIHRYASDSENLDLASINRIAYDLYKKGNYYRSLALYHRAWLITRKTYGESHPDTATSMNNLAELYRAQGRYEEAEPLYVDALKIWQDVLGESHPNTATYPATIKVRQQRQST